MTPCLGACGLAVRAAVPFCCAACRRLPGPLGEEHGPDCAAVGTVALALEADDAARPLLPAPPPALPERVALLLDALLRAGPGATRAALLAQDGSVDGADDPAVAVVVAVLRLLSGAPPQGTTTPYEPP